MLRLDNANTLAEMLKLTDVVFFTQQERRGRGVVNAAANAEGRRVLDDVDHNN